MFVYPGFNFRQVCDTSQFSYWKSSWSLELPYENLNGLTASGWCRQPDWITDRRMRLLSTSRHSCRWLVGVTGIGEYMTVNIFECWVFFKMRLTVMRYMQERYLLFVSKSLTKHWHTARSNLSFWHKFQCSSSNEKCQRAQLFRHSHLRIISLKSHLKMRYTASMLMPIESLIRKCLGRKSNLIHFSTDLCEIDFKKPLVLTISKYVKYPPWLWSRW